MAIQNEKNMLKNWCETNDVKIIKTYVDDDQTFIADLSYNKSCKSGLTTKIEETQRFGTSYSIIINGESKDFSANDFAKFTTAIQNVLNNGKIIEYTDSADGLVCSFILTNNADINSQAIVELTKKHFDFGDKCVQMATCYSFKGDKIQSVQLCNASVSKSRNK